MSHDGAQKTPKNLVLTVAVGNVYQTVSKLTHPSIKNYARRIGADFLSIDQSSLSSPHWEKFQIHTLLNTYERILYVDTDILIREDAPNIFDIVPRDELAMFNEMPFTPENRQISLVESCKEYGIKLKDWNGKYYNTGVMVVPRAWKFIFKKPEKEYFNFYEQGYLNAVVHAQREKVGNENRIFDLPYNWNRMTCMDTFTGEERFASYIMHYAGFPDMVHVMALIQSDIEKWARGNFNSYKRHLFIEVQGGLGDQVEAQPGLRYLMEYVYKDQDINISTHYPILFEDLKQKGAKIYLHGHFRKEPDTPYYYINTLPGPDTMMWNYVSNLLCHTVDYCAMAMLRRILPNEDKSIILSVKDEWIDGAKVVCGEDLENLVLVHAGKHWESKTFPTDWWQDVVDGLQKEGMKVCLIGKNELSRGVLPVVAREGMIDARDLLSLEELIALISKAKVLLSNDSAPIHLAGAFDNHIILIPSCKHPDHIIPYRHGTLTYKAKALYKRLVLDDTPSAPTEIHGSSGQFIHKPWSVYLPEVSEVIEEIKKIFP